MIGSGRERFWWSAAMAAALASVVYLRIAGANNVGRPGIFGVQRIEENGAEGPSDLSYLCAGGAFFDLRDHGRPWAWEKERVSVLERSAAKRCRPPRMKSLKKLRPLVSAASNGSGYGAMLARTAGGRSEALKAADVYLRQGGWAETRASRAFRARRGSATALWYEHGGDWMMVVAFDQPGAAQTNLLFAGRWGASGME